MGCSKSSSKREVYSNTILRKQETSQINNLNLHLKQFEKEEQKNPKVSRRKEIIKVRPEINEKEMKEMIAKINETKYQIQEKNCKRKKKKPWRLNNMLLNNQEITEEIKEYLKANDNENTTTQNLWDVEKQF